MSSTEPSAAAAAQVGDPTAGAAVATEASSSRSTGGTAAAVAVRKTGPIKVDQLRPGTSGHDLTLKILSSKVVVQRTLPGGGGGGAGGGRGGGANRPQRQMRIAECIAGDETGVIVLTTLNEQVDVAKEGTVVKLHNAKIEMFRGAMRLAVDRSGRIEPAADVDSGKFKVKEDNNLSLVEYELVGVFEV